MTGTVRITGAVEVAASLAALAEALPPAIATGDRLAAELVAEAARGRARSVGGVAAHVAPTIAVDSSVESAGVSISGPAALGAEFGGGGKPSTQQFKPYVGAAGYFVNPAATAEAPATVAEYSKALSLALVEVGLE